MKTVENLFGSDTRSYDNKHINNVSSKRISESIINDIEKNGITSEMLDNLGLPVFRYRTQITVHGKFPDGCDVRVGGYKNLVKNQNSSLGVRYTAIDRRKKSYLYSLVCFVSNNYWMVEDSSTAYSLRHIEKIESKEQYDNLMAIAKTISNKMKDRVYASVNAFVAKSCFGGLYGVISINIMAIYEKDIKLAFHTICPDYPRTIADAELELAEKRKADEIRRKEERARINREYAEREKVRQAKRNESLVKVTKITEDFAEQHGFVKYDNFDCRGKRAYVMSIELQSCYDEYRAYIKLIEGKNAIRLETNLNEKFEKASSFERAKRITGTEIEDVWVKVL